MIDTASPAVEGRDGLERPTAGSRREERDVKAEIIIRISQGNIVLAEKTTEIQSDAKCLETVQVGFATQYMLGQAVLEATDKLEEAEAAQREKANRELANQERMREDDAEAEA